MNLTKWASSALCTLVACGDPMIETGVFVQLLTEEEVRHAKASLCPDVAPEESAQVMWRTAGDFKQCHFSWACRLNGESEVVAQGGVCDGQRLVIVADLAGYPVDPRLAAEVETRIDIQ